MEVLLVCPVVNGLLPANARRFPARKSKKPPFQAAAALLSFDLPPSTKTRISAPVGLLAWAEPISRHAAGLR